MAGTLTGGLRDRMVLQSFYNAIQAELNSKGWFDPGRQHAPIVMVDQYPGVSEPPAVNTLAISLGDVLPSRAEMGSLLVRNESFMYADFYAENDALSRHLSGDIAAFLMATPVIAIHDYSAVGDPIDFYAEVSEDTVEISRPTTATNAWQKHWSIVSWAVEDERG